MPVRRWAVGLAATVALLLAAVWVWPALLGGQRYRLLDPTGRFTGTVAVFVSGDKGIPFGMGRVVTQALTARGIRVVAISSPTAFGATTTRTDVANVVAGGIRRALARPGTRRVILVGQSFGSDMLSASLPILPVALRAKIAAITLVVPGDGVFYRADPLGLSYHRAPDLRPAADMRRVDWAPLFCIQGQEEPDSLCPALAGTSAHVVALPGGHFLHHDDARLIATILRQLDAVRV